MEEFAMNTGTITTGMVEVVNNDQMKLTILENGAMEKIRNVRIYHRVK